MTGARRGLAQGVGAYTLWGLLPLFFHLLRGVPASQLLAHRVLWSLLLLVLVALALRRGGAIRDALRGGRTVPLLAASTVLIAINWLVYLWAIGAGHVLAASLGYFINPLLNVALGTALLGERLRRLQLAAVAVAAVGVAVAAVGEGRALWIALALATSFAGYGFVRKQVAIEPLGGLLVETALLAPFALGLLAWAAAHGTGAFGGSPHGDLLLAATGPLTATPLLLFAAAARRLRLVTLGLLQYISPTLQFLTAVLLFGEPLRPGLAAAFALIWAGCALYALDGLRAARVPPVVPAPV